MKTAKKAYIKRLKWRLDLLVGRHLGLLLLLWRLPWLPWVHGAGLTPHGLPSLAQTQHVLDLLGRVVLGASEHKAFGNALATQLVDLCTERMKLCTAIDVMKHDTFVLH